MKRRRLHMILLAALLAIGVAGAWAVRDRCGEWGSARPSVLAAGRAEAPLRAGAARATLAPPLPIVVAGYAPPRPKVSRALMPLQARAVVLEASDVKVAIVSVDLLTLPQEVANSVRARLGDLRLSEVWIAATHSHSSFGGYDTRPVSEVAGTGVFREDARAAVVEACVSAVRAAEGALQAAVLEVGHAERPELSRPRTGHSSDSRLTRVRVRSVAQEQVLAELWLFAAHPTLAPREPPALSPDYPGFVDPDADGSPVILVLQGAVGNAGAVVPPGEDDASQRFARAVRGAFSEVGVARAETVGIAFSRVSFRLPRPDARRLVPEIARATTENILCDSAERTATVSALRFGGLTWIAVPLEPTAEAALALEKASGARVVGLVGGYLGYVDARDAVREGTGESRRQYFGPELLERLEQAASLATSALAPRQR